MPRRPRQTAAAPAITPVTLDALQQFAAPDFAPSQTAMQNLLRAHRTASEDIEAIREAFGGRVDELTASRVLHKKAFGWVKQLDKMEAAKIYDTLAHLLWYIRAGGILQRALAAQPLPMGDDAEAAPENTAAPAPETDEPAAPARRQRRGPAPASNITPFPQMTQQG